METTTEEIMQIIVSNTSISTVQYNKIKEKIEKLCQK
jgi:hypothetical protein